MTPWHRGSTKGGVNNSVAGPPFFVLGVRRVSSLRRGTARISDNERGHGDLRV